MEVASKPGREWGTVVWVLALCAIVLAGGLDAGMYQWMHANPQFGPRNSTDSMIERNLELSDGTALLRALLAGTAPPKPGRTLVVRSKWEDKYEEVAIAISLLAWPDEVRFVIWDDKLGAPKVYDGDKPVRYFYLGHPPKEPIPGLRKIGEYLWFKPGNVTP